MPLAEKISDVYVASLIRPGTLPGLDYLHLSWHRMLNSTLSSRYRSGNCPSRRPSHGPSIMSMARVAAEMPALSRSTSTTAETSAPAMAAKPSSL